jgi:uncharacterized membrane protein
MPYCTNCGTQIDAQWTFCHNCGMQQRPPAGSGTGPPPANKDPLQGISDRKASTLCYIPIFGIIPAIIFLAASRFRSHATVRFDAFQSLYLFVAWLIVSSALRLPGMIFGEHETIQLAKLGMICLYIFLLIRANRGESTRIPILGDLAARSAAEQL